MAEAGYEFEVIPSEAEEKVSLARGFAALVEANALLKAQWVKGRYPDAVVIGADTLVGIDDQVFGKPVDLRQAKEMLRNLSGRTHEVCTGVALCLEREAIERTFSVTTRVMFRQLTDDAIESYFEKVNPLDKAGAYAAQEFGEKIIRSMDGSWSNVVGLPMDELKANLSAIIGMKQDN